MAEVFEKTCFMKFFIQSGIRNQINCVLKPCVEIMPVMTVFVRRVRQD